MELLQLLFRSHDFQISLLIMLYLYFKRYFLCFVFINNLKGVKRGLFTISFPLVLHLSLQSG